MKLTEEQKTTLVGRIKTLVGARKCGLCGADEWLVSDVVFQLTELIGGGNFMLIGGAVVPVIPMTCGRCANTLLLNAITLGVVPPTRPEPESSEPSAAPSNTPAAAPEGKQ